MLRPRAGKTPEAAAVRGGVERHGDELREVFLSDRRAIVSCLVFSSLVNILFLTGPLFMLQVYDRVITSGSAPTLVVLFALVAGLFAFMGVFDHVRQRVSARLGGILQFTLGNRVFQAVLHASGRANVSGQARAGALSNLQTLRRFLASPVPFAFLDAPWSVGYFAVLFLMHWMFGVLAVAGAVLLLGLALLNRYLTREHGEKVSRDRASAEAFQQSILVNSDTVRGLGMEGNMLGRWKGLSDRNQAEELAFSDTSGGFAVSIKTLRLFLQSAMLALGAWLVLLGTASPGVMIVATIIMGRALAPLEQIVSQWGQITVVLHSWRSLSDFLVAVPGPARRTELPDLRGRVEVQSAVVRLAGGERPLLAGIEFALEPGEVLGIVGPTGAGKTSLVRLLVGALPAQSGSVRFDGATREQWDGDRLGRQIGYLPQDIALFNGTIAENIARMDASADAGKVIEAARHAGAHDVIVRLANGYETLTGAGRAALSGGQAQLVALARAFYGEVKVVVLDEPNAHLDADGDAIVRAAVEAARERGITVIVTAHRSNILPACDRLLVIADGVQVAFDERDEIMRRFIRPVDAGAAAGRFGP